jgi:hypothetical protein
LDESSPEFPSTGMTPRKSSGTRTPGEAATPAPTAANVVLDIDRLRASFAQLAEGVCVLHEAGMLHRDLKPSNVLVTREWRVVLLDFGLVANLDVTEMSTSINIVGTPQYMSPEQSSGHPVTEATDWYSVGIMLYEAITGMPPFAGRFQEMLEKKRFAAPTPPGELVAGLPEDLNALCCELLHREPAARPRGREVARRLGHGLVVVRPAEPAPSAKGSLFMGREQHLAALEDAFQASMQDKSVTVHVHGKSGAGKTSLVHRFLRDLRLREKELVLLTGRCYEQESVPYKALDSVIDDLSVHLKRLPPLEAGRLMPRDVLALARLFPVLREVEAVATTRHKAAEIPNTQELRRRAAAALREILTRMADQGPLVLFIDDLQWGDLDSGVLLNELLRPPDAPSLLLLVTYRSEEATSSPLVQMLLKSRASGAATAEVRELEVAELTSQQAQELAAALLGKHRAASGTRAETIARESGGNPFFLKELARHSAAGGEAGAGETTLEELLRSRYARLPEEARTLLEVIAVAGQPMEIGVASRACGLVAEEHPAVDLLRGNRLVRTRTTVERREIEVYHDRIRQTLVKQLSAETLTAHHHRLAWALKSSGRADPEMLAVHFKGAGDIERAFPYAKLAAGQAAEALAFDRAARLYRLALELQTADKSEERALRVKLGEALANAGRGAESAAAFLLAAEGAGKEEGLDLRRRGAEQFLISGHIDEGLTQLHTVLGMLGMKLARTPQRALLALLLRRLQLKMRGLGFVERDASQISSETLQRIDACWSVTKGLSLVDVIRAADFQVRHLILALTAGEPYRIARALALEVGHSTVRGARSQQRTEKLLGIMQAIAERAGNPHALGLGMVFAGAAASIQGRFVPALEMSQRAEALLREKCTGVTWELDTALIFGLHSLIKMGEWKELGRQLPALLQEAQERGDLYLGTYFRTRTTYVLRLVADEPERALEEQRRGIAAWSVKGFHVQHYWDWYARGEIALYVGDARAAWDAVTGRWKELNRSLLMRTQGILIEALHLRARAALAMAAELMQKDSRAEASKFLQEAERDAERIAREKSPAGESHAILTDASVAAARGDVKKALVLLASAEEGFRTTALAQYAAATQRRRGELLGGEQGKTLVEAADGWMASQDIVNPGRMMNMLAPGRWQAGK